MLQARFSPPAVGAYSGVLTIHSNDPDTPQAALPMAGSGLLPPSASVNPTSLTSNLFTGESETQQFTISNLGATDLEWQTQLSFLAPTAVFPLTAPQPPTNTVDVDGATVETVGRTTPIQIQLADLTGVNILWDRSHGQTSTSSWATIIADFESRGATLTENTDPITPELLANYDVIWSVDTNSS